MQKFAGEVFGGSTLTLNGEVDFSDSSTFTMKVFASRSVPVLFKLEGLNVERSVTHTGSGWEELSFDFAGDTGAGVTQITLIFDLGVNGDAGGDADNWTFLFDDIALDVADGAISSSSYTSYTLPRGELKDLSPVSGLFKLTNLSLVNSKIEDLTPLSTLTNLQQLDVTVYQNESPQITDLTPLANLKSLVQLGLGGHAISDISAITDLETLVVLSLQNNELTSLEDLPWPTID